MTLMEALQQAGLNALANWLGKEGNMPRLEVVIEVYIENFVTAREEALAAAEAAAAGTAA